MDVYQVLENQVNGHYHAIPEGETQTHLIGSECPCIPTVEIYAERHGGKRIYRHRPTMEALKQQIAAVKEAIADLRSVLPEHESD